MNKKNHVTQDIIKTLIDKGYYADFIINLIEPTLYNVQNWLRTNKKIEVISFPYEGNNYPQYIVDIYKIDDKGFIPCHFDDGKRYDTYQECLNEAIKEALNLI